MAQSVERILGKDEVTGSIPVSSSKNPFAKANGVFTYCLLPLHCYFKLSPKPWRSEITSGAFADFAE